METNYNFCYTLFLFNYFTRQRVEFGAILCRGIINDYISSERDSERDVETFARITANKREASQVLCQKDLVEIERKILNEDALVPVDCRALVQLFRHIRESMFKKTCYLEKSCDELSWESFFHGAALFAEYRSSICDYLRQIFVLLRKPNNCVFYTILFFYLIIYENIRFIPHTNYFFNLFLRVFSLFAQLCHFFASNRNLMIDIILRITAARRAFFF